MAQVQQEVNRKRQVLRNRPCLCYCNYCKKEFSTQEAKRQHERKVHRKKGEIHAATLSNIKINHPLSFPSNILNTGFKPPSASTSTMSSFVKYKLVPLDSLQTSISQMKSGLSHDAELGQILHASLDPVEKRSLYQQAQQKHTGFNSTSIKATPEYMSIKSPLHTATDNSHCAHSVNDVRVKRYRNGNEASNSGIDSYKNDKRSTKARYDNEENYCDGSSTAACTSEYVNDKVARILINRTHTHSTEVKKYPNERKYADDSSDIECASEEDDDSFTNTDYSTDDDDGNRPKISVPHRKQQTYTRKMSDNKTGGMEALGKRWVAYSSEEDDNSEYTTDEVSNDDDPSDDDATSDDCKKTAFNTKDNTGYDPYETSTAWCSNGNKRRKYYESDPNVYVNYYLNQAGYGN
jgi:hypothetical protein